MIAGMASRGNRTVGLLDLFDDHALRYARIPRDADQRSGLMPISFTVVVRNGDRHPSESASHPLTIGESHLLLEEARKSWDYIISDEIVYGSECCEPNLEPAITTRDWLAEYDLHRLWFEVRSKHIGERDPYLYAVIELADRVVRRSNTDHSTLDLRLLDRQRSMLVNSAEPIENPEGMVLEPLPSVIRLKRLNYLYSIRKHVLNRVSEPELRMVSNGERGLSMGAGNMKPREEPCKLIQTGSQAIGEFSNKHCDLGRNGLVLNANDVPELLWIILARDGVRFRVRDLSKFGFEFVEVRPCPGNLQLYIE
jgi:hypothetical protein